MQAVANASQGTQKDQAQQAVDEAQTAEQNALDAKTAAAAWATFETTESAEPAAPTASPDPTAKPLYSCTPATMPWPRTAFANAILDEARLDVIEADHAGWKATYAPSSLYAAQIATIPGDTLLLALPGSEEDGLLQVGNDVVLLQGSATDQNGYVLRRLGTTLVDEIARKLF